MYVAWYPEIVNRKNIENLYGLCETYFFFIQLWDVSGMKCGGFHVVLIGYPSMEELEVEQQLQKNWEILQNFC